MGRNFANQCNSKFSKKRHKIIAAQSVTVVYLFKLLMGRLLAETGTFRGRGTGRVSSSWTSDQMLRLYESCLSLSSLPLSSEEFSVDYSNLPVGRSPNSTGLKSHKESKHRSTQGTMHPSSGDLKNKSEWSKYTDHEYLEKEFGRHLFFWNQGEEEDIQASHSMPHAHNFDTESLKDRSANNHSSGRNTSRTNRSNESDEDQRMGIFSGRGRETILKRLSDLKFDQLNPNQLQSLRAIAPGLESGEIGGLQSLLGSLGIITREEIERLSSEEGEGNDSSHPGGVLGFLSRNRDSRNRGEDPSRFVYDGEGEIRLMRNEQSHKAPSEAEKKEIEKRKKEEEKQREAQKKKQLDEAIGRLEKLGNDLAMGWPKDWCEAALRRCNCNVEMACNFLFENSEQMDEFLAQDRAMKAAREARMQSSGSTNTSGDSSEKSGQNKVDLTPLIRRVAGMGFKESWAEKALQQTNNDVNAAIDWILMNSESLERQDEEDKQKDGDARDSKGERPSKTKQEKRKDKGKRKKKRDKKYAELEKGMTTENKKKGKTSRNKEKMDPDMSIIEEPE